ncbi:hypothetical protein [Streptomyces sp. NBC_00019]|uniref:hypothetical protein n=1 Tax=Streptomyces sp. NBC_00019 TaxID=2975623 RepID=UPI00324615E6
MITHIDSIPWQADIQLSGVPEFNRQAFVETIHRPGQNQRATAAHDQLNGHVDFVGTIFPMPFGPDFTLQHYIAGGPYDLSYDSVLKVSKTGATICPSSPRQNYQHT